MAARYNSFFLRNSWYHKITVVIIAVCYFIALIFVNDNSYIWITIALIFILFISTFICTTESSPILLQLRGTRLAEISRRTMAEEENDDRQSTHTTIWMTDIPPSYSFVMSNVEPPTPPPSYGSAILMFPLLNLDGNPMKTEATLISEIQNTRHPLSISTQVSVCSFNSESHLPITFSTQVSVSGISELLVDTLSLRTQLFLSRPTCENIDVTVSVPDVEEDINNLTSTPINDEQNESIFQISEDSVMSESNDQPFIIK